MPNGEVMEGCHVHRLSVHGDTVPLRERDAAGIRKTEPRSRAGKVANNAESWRDRQESGGK